MRRLKIRIDLMICAAKFSVTATGANLSYQWQKTIGAETNDISGATNNSYEIAKVALADNGSKFSCKVTNLAGTTLSSAGNLDAPSLLAEHIAAGRFIAFSLDDAAAHVAAPAQENRS